ncbi:response regulator transcription factor [Fodinicola feengrottensis]|uniref:Response regulator transcription factor n=1 Tax=Fodinicola feengrottensis TaxID=435914 RepID=A0ABN2GPL4_9ACTN
MPSRPPSLAVLPVGDPPSLPVELTVVLADGHPVIRSGMRALLSAVNGIRVVAEAGTAAETIRAALLHRPDVVILDPEMPEPVSGASIRELARAVPGTGILVFTMAEDDTSIRIAMRCGARGYILKHAERDHIVRAVRGVAAGEAIFAPRIAERLPVLLARVPQPAHEDLPSLTVREREVLSLVAEGLPNSAIARRLRLAPKTISNHLSAIFGKLQVTSRADAIARAHDAGLTS